MSSLIRGVCALVASAFLGMLPSSALAAQEGTVAEDLLKEARQLIDDLEWRGADSVVGIILATPNLRRAYRIQALQIRAIARYPDVVRDQQPTRAIETLEEMLRFAPTARPPASLTWRGLDSLYSVVRRSTFGLGLIPTDSVTIVGFESVVPVEARTTRDATFRLLVTPRNGSEEAIVVDSSGPGTGATLRLQPVMGERPRFPSGAYTLTVEARDVMTGERLTARMIADLDTPPLSLHRIPVAWDSAGYRPVRTLPSRTSSIMSGLLVGAFTAMSVRAYQSDRLATGPSSNGRAATWGVGLGLSVAAGSWFLDRGRELPANIDHNTKLINDWTTTRNRLLDENDAARRNYRGRATMRLEDQ